MNRTPAKQRMEAVSAASMANSLYPSLMKGKAEPHRQLQMTAKATAKAGVPNRVSSRAVRGRRCLDAARV